MRRFQTARLPQARTAEGFTDLPHLAPTLAATSPKTPARIAELLYPIVVIAAAQRAVHSLQRQGAGGCGRDRRQRRGAREAVRIGFVTDFA